MAHIPIQNGNPLNARTLSFTQLEAWSATGAAHHDELIRIIKDIIISLQRRSSPAKNTQAAIKRLEGFFGRREVRGSVNFKNSRHINFRLSFPTTSGSGLIFSLLHGEINARSGAVKFSESRSIQMSIHALERLFERLDDTSDGAVLDEVYSCIGQVDPWYQGASKVNAKCWPHISTNGFFIATSENESATSTFVTWIKKGGTGKKWGLPIANLTRLKNVRPEQLEDSGFAKEFIRSFPWMLHEHVPGENFFATSWEREDGQENLPDEESAQNEHLTNDELYSAELPKRSSSYVPGLNYRNDPPSFKTHSAHAGVVVQQRDDGSLIVGLRNGWIGQVPFRSISRGVQLISGYTPPGIGEEIDVVVYKITHYTNEKAYGLSLDPKDISDAKWMEVKKEHSIGSVFRAMLLTAHIHEFIAHLETGTRGVLAASEVQLYLSQPNFKDSSPLGLTVNAVVTGYRDEKKLLLLSIQHIETIPTEELQRNQYQDGAQVRGKCIRHAPTFAFIELPHGVYGILHKLNNWGYDLPAIGSDVAVVVVGRSDSTLQLAGVLPDPSHQIFYARPLTPDLWKTFIERNSIGDVVEVQNLFWNEGSYSFMVSTRDGIVGTMASSEVSWSPTAREEKKFLLKPGEIIKARILSFDPARSRVYFSKKALEKNALDEHLARIEIGSSAEGLVVNVLDYGCFVQLQPYGVQALLHRSKIPEGKVFSKGDVITVFIDNVDLTNKRVSLKLVQN